MIPVIERIKARMAVLNLNQSELARRAGMSQPAVYKMLSGKSVRTMHLPEIARALDVGLNPFLIRSRFQSLGGGALCDPPFLRAMPS